jgi:hypothetical protein
VRGAATTRSSQDHEEARSRRLRHGNGTFVGEPAPKRQKTAESGGAEQLLGSTTPAATPAASGEAGGGEVVSAVGSTTIAAANTATPGNAASTSNLARAAGPASTASDAFSEKAPPVDRGILLRKEGYPDHWGRMGGGRLHVGGISSCFSLFHLISAYSPY